MEANEMNMVDLEKVSGGLISASSLLSAQSTLQNNLAAMSEVCLTMSMRLEMVMDRSQGSTQLSIMENLK
jgi:hypothetical protein